MRMEWLNFAMLHISANEHERTMSIDLRLQINTFSKYTNEQI